MAITGFEYVFSDQITLFKVTNVISQPASELIIPYSELWYLLCNCSQGVVTKGHWVNIGSGNYLVPSGTKPLPEPILTEISVAIWRH